MKQMTLHLNEVIDFSVNNQMSFIDTLIKLTNYEIDVRAKYDSIDGESGCVSAPKRNEGF
ncbi:hypothetical protein J6TS2_48980 [Heyndrickxia sporothermodurans]|nr:hypothetical protein J6TS2_48980 [Heyndrickxia sporothermodurans]